MKFSCIASHMTRAVGIAERFCGKNITLPSLSHVFIDAEGNTITVTATNLEHALVWRVPGRVTRSAKDTFNVMLNYGYGILYNELERCCLYTGLDPYTGFYHADRYGQVSLVFDMIEEFRVPLVDVVAVGLAIKYANLPKKLASQGLLLKEGKKILVTHIYSRLNKRIIWHGQRMRVRTAVKNQVQHLARYLTGEEREYIPFRLEDYHPWRY